MEERYETTSSPDEQLGDKCTPEASHVESTSETIRTDAFTEPNASQALPVESEKPVLPLCEQMPVVAEDLPFPWDAKESASDTTEPRQSIPAEVSSSSDENISGIEQMKTDGTQETEAQEAGSTNAETSSTDSNMPAIEPAELPLQQPKEVITFQLPDEPFAKIIQQIRLDAEVSIKEVSDKTRISAAFINDLEQQNFAALPAFDICLAKIEQLCLEYDKNPQQLLDKFSVEYKEHKKDEPEHVNTHLPYSYGKHGPGRYLQTRPSRLPGLPAIFIGTVLLLLIGLLSYAFYAYRTHQMPEKLNADLTEHIPLHEPQVILLDEVRR